jgi:hypothetical protein
MIQIATTKRALYFGYRERGGHYLQEAGKWREPGKSDIPGFPDVWFNLLDGGLLRNGKHPDVYDGKVFWTCGGTPLWLAFFWWDRSGDTRGNSCSGFYVTGFAHTDLDSAFNYAGETYPHVIVRQRYPLVIQQSPGAK